MSQTISYIIQQKLVPVFYHEDAQWCINVMDTCFKNDILVFEFTNRGQNALHTFSLLHQFQQAHCTGMLLGAGTVFDKQAAADFIAAGAAFIVSPCFVDEVYEVCKQNNIPYLPGCMTVKEILDATKAGCEMVKVFPGAVVGIEFVKAVKAVLPDIQLMVTGGVSEQQHESLVSSRH